MMLPNGPELAGDRLLSAMRGDDACGRDGALMELNALFSEYLSGCSAAGIKFGSVRLAGGLFLGEAVRGASEQISWIAMDVALYVFGSILDLESKRKGAADSRRAEAQYAHMLNGLSSDAKVFALGVGRVKSLLSDDSGAVLSEDPPFGKIDDSRVVPVDETDAGGPADDGDNAGGRFPRWRIVDPVSIAAPEAERETFSSSRRKMSHLSVLYKFISDVLAGLKAASAKAYDYLLALLAANKLTRKAQAGRPKSRRTREVGDDISRLFEPAMGELAHIGTAGEDPFAAHGFITRKQRCDWRKKCLEIIVPVMAGVFAALPKDIRENYPDLPARIAGLIESVTYRKANY